MMLPQVHQLQGTIVQAPDGMPGVEHTLQRMRDLVRSGRVDPAVRGTALTLIALLPEHDRAGEINALFEFVRDRIRYVPDVLDVETLATAGTTLATAAGDCDDKSVLLAALLESIGIATQFMATGYASPTWFDHVYVRALLPSGEWLALDPTEPHAAGWEPPAAAVVMYEGG